MAMRVQRPWGGIKLGLAWNLGGGGVAGTEWPGGGDVGHTGRGKELP